MDQYNGISTFSIIYVYLYNYNIQIYILYCKYVYIYVRFFIILIPIQSDTAANLTTCPLRSSHAQIFRWKPVRSTMIRPQDWATTKAPISRHHTLVATFPCEWLRRYDDFMTALQHANGAVTFMSWTLYVLLRFKRLLPMNTTDVIGIICSNIVQTQASLSFLLEQEFSVPDTILTPYIFQS